MNAEALVPYDDLPSEAWTRLERAADDPTDPMRLVVLATVRDTDQPDARILVLRGARRDSARLWFHTDARAAKFTQLRSRPHAAGVTYDATAGVQLRVRGEVRLHHDDESARQHWDQLDMHVRQSYALATAPGQRGTHQDPRARKHRERQLALRTEDGWCNFGVIALHVDEIEWLQVGPLGDRRATLCAADDWIAQPLVP